MTKQSDAKRLEVVTDTANVKARRATATVGVLKVTRPKEPPKRAEVQEPLSDGQRKELNALIQEWVATSQLVGKPLNQGQAYVRLYRYCLNDAVNSIRQIEAAEFDECKKWLTVQIRIAEGKDPEAALKKPGQDARLTKVIHAQCKRLGISEQRRKEYMKARWGRDSLTELSNRELQIFATYLRQDNPTMLHKEPTNERDHQLRVKALAGWLDEMEAETAGTAARFDRHAIRMTKTEIHDALKARDRQLFSIAPTTFEKFWKDKPGGMCTMKRGRRSEGA